MKLAYCQIVALLASASLLAVSAPSSHGQRLLLISFDGFRWDLLNSTMAPTITAWAEKSTWFTNGSQSQYISNTAPNHMSIVTGLHIESHGIVANAFFDPARNAMFDIYNITKTPGIVNASRQEQWYPAEPIWITNQRNGVRSALYDWPMGEANFQGDIKQPSFYKAYVDVGNTTTWMADIEGIVESFSSGANFVAWYVAEPDHVLHEKGFYHEGTLRKKIAELDKLFGSLLEKLATKGLFDATNIILTADHGHAEVVDAEHAMCVPRFLTGVPGKDYAGGDQHIYASKDGPRGVEIFNNLTNGAKQHKYNITLKWKEDLPEWTHYGGSERVGGIVLEPGIGSTLYIFCDPIATKEKRANYHSSAHGHDPRLPEMRAMLVMGGPAFRAEHRIEDVPQNIDLYGLMTDLLGVPPNPNNGTYVDVGNTTTWMADIEGTRKFYIEFSEHLLYEVYNGHPNCDISLTLLLHTLVIFLSGCLVFLLTRAPPATSLSTL